MRKVIIEASVIVLLIVSTLYSLYKWQQYAYWSKSSWGNVIGFKELYNDKNYAAHRDENAKLIEYFQTQNEYDEESKREWRVIFAMNGVTLLLVLFLLKKPNLFR